MRWPFDHLSVLTHPASSLLKCELERYCNLVHSIQPQWKRNIQKTLNSLNYSSLKPDEVWDLRHDDVKMKYCEMWNTLSLLHESLLVLHFSLSGLGKPCWENSTHPESITGLAGESKAFWNANGGLYNCILHGALRLCFYNAVLRLVRADSWSWNRRGSRRVFRYRQIELSNGIFWQSIGGNQFPYKHLRSVPKSPGEIMDMLTIHERQMIYSTSLSA